MKMNKKGFTLIELLAVIVILAIIALIATPLILNVIDQAREGAAKNSAYGYASAVESYLALELLKPSTTVSMTGTFTNSTISVKGTKPSAVSLTISNGTITGGTITVDGYISTFGTNGSITTITKS